MFLKNIVQSFFSPVSKEYDSEEDVLLNEVEEVFEECKKHLEKKYFHNSIKLLLRRISASFKNTEELEREYELWYARIGEDGDLYADHPKNRVEIIISELRTRGIEIIQKQYPVVNVKRPVMQKQEILSVNPFRADPDTEHLINAIQEATHEAELWHSFYDENPASYRDAVEQVTHVRHLHAVLKKEDRRRGINRNRMDFAIRMNEI